MKIARAKNYIFLLLAFIPALATPVWGGQLEEELINPAFFAGEKNAVPARSLRPASRIAENVTVITSDQIEALNAHTLAEVLNTVPGIQLEQVRTPGSWAYFNIQGALSKHVQVLIDGVPQNDLVENAPDVGMIQVQHIERIEIIKGAASAALGQALGGVINVVTKMPDAGRAIGGTAVVSYGKRATTEVNGELSGSIKSFGYYLNGLYTHSNGLIDGNQVERNNAYGKITYDLPSKGYLTLGFDYRASTRGVFSSPDFDAKDTDESTHGYSFLNFTYPIDNRLTLELSARESRKNHEYSANTFAGQFLEGFSSTTKDKTKGTSAKLTWGDSLLNLIMGIDYAHDSVSKTGGVLAPDSLSERAMDRWGVYSNGTVTFGDLTILPGIRFDDTGIDTNLLSYTMGATYTLGSETVLRAYGARGYSLPSALNLKDPEQVWTIQVGAESSSVPYVWLKGTFFYNRLWDISNFFQPELKKAVMQGGELEIRTVPLYGMSIAVGHTFTDARNRETGERLNTVPVNSTKLSLLYDESRFGLRGVLTGNYVHWNAPTHYQARDASILWDLSLTKIFNIKDVAPELFFTVHNILDSSQYQIFLYKNTGRWLEGGVRFRF